MDTISGWLKDLGIDPSTAESAKSDAQLGGERRGRHSASRRGGRAQEQLSSLVFYLAMTALSLIFLLKDGPEIRAWGERHMAVPLPLAQTISRRSNPVAAGLLLRRDCRSRVQRGGCDAGRPDPRSAAGLERSPPSRSSGKRPRRLGAWTAGAFSVLVALGGAGTDAAIGMIVVQLLANGLLQQLVQPIAMGSCARTSTRSRS